MKNQLLPPIASLTSEDKGPVVIVYTYILLVLTIVFTGVKVASTFFLKRKFSWDDALVSVAIVLALAQSIVTERSAINGVGRYQQSLSQDQLETYFKCSFASNILSFVVQSLAKASAIHLLQRLGAASTSRLTFPLLYSSIVTWLTFSILALGFQCGLTRPWFYQSSRCVEAGALWYPILILNLLTDLIIGLFFAPIIWKMQISLVSKWRISALFAVRLIVCGLTIAQLICLRLALHADDTTRTMVAPTILAQFVMNFSILTAVSPSLYRFINELHSGPGFGGMIDRMQYEMGDSSQSDNSKDRETLRQHAGLATKHVKIFVRPGTLDNTFYDTSINNTRKTSAITTVSNEFCSEESSVGQTIHQTAKPQDRDIEFGRAK